jgi:hypothetical protein
MVKRLALNRRAQVPMMKTATLPCEITARVVSLPSVAAVEAVGGVRTRHRARLLEQAKKMALQFPLPT